MVLFVQIFTTILNALNLSYNLKGFAIASAFLMLVAVFSVIFIGTIMNGIQRLQLALLQKIFGLNIALFFCNYLTIAGTILHESAHALFGILSGAKIVEVSFLDRNGDTLGHVLYIPRGNFILRGIQDTAIACAPIFAGLTAEYFLLKGILDEVQPVWWSILRWYLVIAIINHMSMSSIDIKNYFHGIWVVAPLLFGLILAAASLLVPFAN